MNWPGSRGLRWPGNSKCRTFSTTDYLYAGEFTNWAVMLDGIELSHGMKKKHYIEKKYDSWRYDL